MRFAVVASVLLLACASGSPNPDQPSPVRPRVIQGGGMSDVVLGRDDVTPRSTSIAAPVDAVWPLALQAYRALGLRTDAVDQAAHQATTQHLTLSRHLGEARPSRYFRCGSGITGNIADEWQLDINGDMVVEPEDADSSRSVVSTRLSATARDASGMAVCTSTGSLEKALGEAILKGLPAKAGSGAD